MFEIMEAPMQEAVIKVIGVGGCGGNAVDHMIVSGLDGVEFICANTDAQAIKRSQAQNTLQLGSAITKGLGAGAKPEIGRAAAEEDRERIAEMIQGANMLFITAGMGGGTGTGAAPIVAEVAKEMGILTVAVVTKPFAFERAARTQAALEGLEKLRQNVDSLIVVPNDKLMEVLGEDISVIEAYAASNNVLHGAVSGISEIINGQGLVNVDFADVKTVMSENGIAMMGSSTASGVDRARIAAESAAHSPLLEDIDLKDARGVLVNITASTSFKMREFHEVMETVKEFTAEDATVIVGQVFDDNMGDSLRVTMVATGLGGVVSRQQTKPQLVVRTGTDNAPMEVDYAALDQPAVMRRRERGAQIEAMKQSGVDFLDIPAFLRKQAD